MIDLFSPTEDKRLPFDFPDKEGYAFAWNEEHNGFVMTVPHGQLFYSEHFFSEKISNRSIEYFLENDSNDWQQANWREFDKEKLADVKFKNIAWQHDKLNMYGKEVYLPRYSAWYGDSDTPYTYSGLTLQPKAWNRGLLYIKEKIDSVAGVAFNSVLMNWYRDGNDYINWHSDSEKELGQNPIIASVNFGATRDFIIRRNDDNTEKLTIPLGHGTLLIMKGALQHHWEHAVPKRTKLEHTRINLTFRVIKKD
jgi:alkylated DNA repair dioxygenase AlkB